MSPFPVRELCSRLSPSAVIVVSKKRLVQDEVACERERGVTLESIAVWG